MVVRLPQQNQRRSGGHEHRMIYGWVRKLCSGDGKVLSAAGVLVQTAGNEGSGA